jgi:hypothetical protein
MVSLKLARKKIHSFGALRLAVETRLQQDVTDGFYNQWAAMRSRQKVNLNLFNPYCEI